MTTTITRLLEIDAGHRLVNHESKCANLHGHRYGIEVECTLSGELDDVGRVVDFSVIKAVFGQWLDDNLDHAFIFNAADPMADAFRSSGRHFEMPVEPTAENIAALLLDVASQLLDEPRFYVSMVRVRETPNCIAEVRR